MFGQASWAVKKGAKAAGRAITEANLAVTALPGGDAIPLRRLGFGLSMFADPRGSTLLDFLGDDLDERAGTLDRFLDHCTDEEMTDLLFAFQEAAHRRALRQATTNGPARPRRQRDR